MEVNNSLGVIVLIVVCAVLHICIGSAIGVKYVSSHYVVGIQEHEDEIITAFALFWLIIIAGWIIKDLLLFVLDGFKGLCYLIKKSFKED